MTRGSTQRSTLFKATIKSKDTNEHAKLITCALKSQHGKLLALLFYLSGSRKNAGSVEIDLTRFSKVDTTDLKKRILRIIDNYLG